MTKLFRKKVIPFLVLMVILMSLFIQAEAFSISLNPVTFLSQTTSIIVNRVSDIIHYLVMQKQYTFDNFTDPNIYPPLNIPTNLEKVSLPSATEEEISSGKPIPVGTSTLPVTRKPASETRVSVPSQIIPSAPVLVVKSDSAVGEIREPISDYINNSQILNYTNEERKILSLKPLVSSKTLDVIANLRADDLFTNQYFEHSSPDGKSAPDLAKLVGYNYSLIGENLALGNFGGDRGIVSAWMDSPGHKANILNDRYEELGVAVKEGTYNGEKTIIAVQIFAEPQILCAKPNQDTKSLIDSSSLSIKEMQVEALAMFNNLNAIKSNPKLDQVYYNQKVQEYNYFARRINAAVIAIKGVIDLYNAEVGKYNSCISS